MQDMSSNGALVQWFAALVTFLTITIAMPVFILIWMKIGGTQLPGFYAQKLSLKEAFCCWSDREMNPCCDQKEFKTDANSAVEKKKL